MGHRRNKLEEAEVALDKFHYHEAQDRAFMIGNMISEYLAEHPVIMKHPELRKRIKLAETSVCNVYQLITSLSEEAFPSEIEVPGKE